MRFVIYDDDTMEPITVVNLPGIAERDITERMGNLVYLAVTDALPPPSVVKEAEAPHSYTKMKVVELHFERFVRRGQVSLMCFTHQAELAMLLDPDFLPGQRAHVQRLEQQNERLAALITSAIFGHRD